MSKQQGLSLYIAVIIMVILLAIVLGMGTILKGQLKTIKGMENSVIAFYAAETGIEQVLMNRTNPSPVSGSLDNGATYSVEVVSSCSAPNFCIRSVGEYRGIKRAIEVAY